MNKKLEELLPIAQLLAEQDLAGLGTNSKIIAALRSRLTALSLARANVEMSVPTRSRTEASWSVWVERERNRINEELALALADRESLICKLRLSFGRSEVLAQLVAGQSTK